MTTDKSPERQHIEAFSPEDLEQISNQFYPDGYIPTTENNQEYLESVGLKDATFSAEAFDTYDKGRIKDIEGFKTAKTSSEELIHEKLLENKGPESLAVQTALKGIFTPPTALELAPKNYKASIDAFKKLAEEIPKKYHPKDLQPMLKDITDKGKADIEALQKNEIKSLVAQFEDDAFRKNLMTALKLSNEKQLEDIKTNLLTELKASHTKQLEEFNKSAEESSKNLLKAEEKHMEDFLQHIILIRLYKESPEMRDKIKALAKNSTSLTTVEVSGNDDNNDTHMMQNISSVSLKQLDFIKHHHGGTITTGENPDGSRKYTLEMGKRILNPRYYLLDHDKKDMLLMAESVRASGASSIMMTVKFSKQETADKRARNAYEACINSGFPPEKIKIKMVVNGKELILSSLPDKDDKEGNTIQSVLYREKPDEFQNLQKSSAEIRGKLEKLTSRTPTDMKAMKAAYTHLRDIETTKAGLPPIVDSTTPSRTI